MKKIISPIPLVILGLLGTLCASTSNTALANTEAFTACMQRLQQTAGGNGVRADFFAQQTRSIIPDMGLLEKLNFQPEFKTPIWDYMAALVDDERITDGQQQLRDQANTLQDIERRYRVPAATVVAVWGIESNFGKQMGNNLLVDSLATLSCFGRRQAFFQNELFATLRLLQDGHIQEKPKGSWAGAFGHTQFMPTTYERLAVDQDGDGRKDLIGNVADALASTAHFLNRAGWQSGLPWGVEVRLPPRFDGSLAGRTAKRSLQSWADLGMQLANGQPLTQTGMPMDTRVGLLLLAGTQGPAFLTTRNFDALYSYNAAESYGLAIAHLSDRLRGAGPIHTPWPTDDLGLSRAQRRTLQTLLINRGHDIGPIDGALGEKSKAAIIKEQNRLGLPATGRAGQKLLQALSP